MNRERKERITITITIKGKKVKKKIKKRKKKKRKETLELRWGEVGVMENRYIERGGWALCCVGK